ncbi:MAG: hypothetical protein ACK5EO_12315 [Planctomycetota bacterium]|jgi:hypothetical protein
MLDAVRLVVAKSPKQVAIIDEVESLVREFGEDLLQWINGVFQQNKLIRNSNLPNGFYQARLEVSNNPSPN